MCCKRVATDNRHTARHQSRLARPRFIPKRQKGTHVENGKILIFSNFIIFNNVKKGKKRNCDSPPHIADEKKAVAAAVEEDVLQVGYTHSLSLSLSLSHIHTHSHTHMQTPVPVVGGEKGMQGQRQLLQTLTFLDGAVYVRVYVDCMNDAECVSLAMEAHVAMKRGDFGTAVSSVLKPFRSEQGLSGNASVSFYSELGATPFSASGEKLDIEMSDYPAFRDPFDRDAVDVCAAPGSLDSYCVVHHTCLMGLFCKKGTCRPCGECRYQGDSSGPENMPTNTVVDPPDFSCSHINCPGSPMCPNRPQADGQMSTGCPVGCPDTYDSIYMPPQCTAMIADSEIDEKLKQTAIATDYCGHIEDSNIIIGISLCLVIAVTALCGCVKISFDALEEEVEDDKECMRNGVYRGPE